jgi:ubiquinone/menaquinone biosynthesis C-methylase UbiE
VDDDLVSYWDAAAATFDQEVDHGLSDAGARQAWSELLGTVLPPTPARVADLGCGTGTLSVLLAEMGYAVDGLDFSGAMLERARRKAEGHEALAFHLGDAADPPLPAAAFDVVLCRHVLWALPEPEQALRRWRGLLAPRGRLVLVEGLWHTGAGVAASQALTLLAQVGLGAELIELRDPRLWGTETSDERYMIVSTNRSEAHTSNRRK